LVLFMFPKKSIIIRDPSLEFVILLVYRVGC
jgi:hypothetical protein